MSDPGMQRLMKLLELESEIRENITIEGFRYNVVTRTRELISYDQCVLVSYNDKGKAAISAISDVSTPEQNAPFALWLKKLANVQYKKSTSGSLTTLSAADFDAGVANDWKQWAPDNVLWVPLLTPSKDQIGALWLMRRTEWIDAETIVLERLGASYAHIWENLKLKSRSWKLFNKKNYIAVAVGLVLCGFIPVSQTVLAPAEVVAKKPLVISAPLSGVIAEIDVTPNQRVKAGDILVRFDERELKSNLAIVTQGLEIARAEYLTARQGAFNDYRNQEQLALLKARVGLKEAELHYAESLLERAVIRASKDGVAVFRDANDWLGRPVQTGEKIMLLADPQEVRLQVDVPVDDAISLDKGNRVQFFLDVDPINAREAQITGTSYNTQLSGDGTRLYFSTVAHFKETTAAPHIGLRGTAKLYGDKSTLFMHLFRKPIAALRQLIGW